MFKRFVTLSLTISICGALPSFSFAQANDRDNDEITNWWQVEIIMFTQGANWSTTTEIWPTDIELHYPNQWQQLTPLIDPNAETETVTDGVDNTINQTNTVTATQQSTDNGSTNNVSTDNIEDTFLDPGLIKLLPEEELQLTEMSSRLNRGRRRVLFHGAWRQYMERDQDEAPIIFTAGDQYDDHYELEGSIHLYVQRLLHFDINMWFTEFSINAGQERLPWPELPQRPNQELPQYNLAGLDKPATALPNTLLNNNQNQNNALPPGTFINPNDGAINTLDWFDQRGNTTFYDSRYDEILSRNYVINNLALIQEDRPMRSNELHYIDHPLVGILVKIDRYQPPEPEGLEPDPLDALLGPKPQ